VAGQEKVQKPSDEVVEDEVVAAVAADTSARDAEVDAILDEIDDVLETNAEEFVAAFVQKGGQ
jgi:ubiquitin-like protein Pup